MGIEWDLAGLNGKYLTNNIIDPIPRSYLNPKSFSSGDEVKHLLGAYNENV